MSSHYPRPGGVRLRELDKCHGGSLLVKLVIFVEMLVIRMLITVFE